METLQQKLDRFSSPLEMLRTSQMGPYQFPIPSEFSNWREEQRAWRESIALMAQQGVDAIALSGGGGSSAMPHKSNPVLAELLITLARFNATQLSAMHHSLVHEQERSGAAWMLEWMVLPQMAMATGSATLAAKDLCKKIRQIGDDG